MPAARILEVPYNQLGDMSKKHAQNLSVLRVDDTMSYTASRRAGAVQASTAPSPRSGRTNFQSTPRAPHVVKDSTFARWEVSAIAQDSSLDAVLRKVAALNDGTGHKVLDTPILKIKVKFSDASELTFVRVEPTDPSSLKYLSYYAPPTAACATAVPPQSLSQTFAKPGSSALPQLNSGMSFPNKEQRTKLFRRVDPNGNGLLSLAELDKAVMELWPHYRNKPAIMRAYKSADINGSGFIGKGEFEYFLRYLVNFNSVWKMFCSADTDNDQRVSCDEFVSAMRRLEPNKSDADLRATFAKVDTNHGGQVLFIEFCAFVAGKRTNVIGFQPNVAISKLASIKVPSAPASARKPAKRPAPLVMPSVSERKALFRRVDPNGNGLMSLAELDKAVIELWPRFNNKPAIMRAYKAADANGTGFVGKSEFEFFLRYLMHFNNLWAAFADADASGDRRISLAEFLAVRDRLQIGTEVEARNAFAAMDANHGGYVLFIEFCDWMSKHKAAFEVQFSQPQPKPPKAKSTTPRRTPGHSARRTPTTPKHDVSKMSVQTVTVPSKAECKALFRRVDPNGNGLLSLAELDKAVIESWPQWNNKSAIMRAYKSADTNQTGFVGKSEFEFFMRYLAHYNNLWAAFADIDTSNDRRVNRDEFVAGAHQLGIRLQKPEVERFFKTIDRNGGGEILFDEFCSALGEMKAMQDMN
jgi:Ca2+-binding EF-hand superfamily protein